jgi:serine/threonine protein phosphatase 1
VLELDGEMTANAEVPELVCEGPAAVLGDIHGCSSALETLLAQLPGREIFVIGDVCDRGPDTRGVIERLLRSRARGVLGNHEEWLRQWLQDGTLARAVAHGGMGSRFTLKSYGVSDGTLVGAQHLVPESHRQWLAALEHVAGLTVAGQRFWLVHAGISPTLLRCLGGKETVAAIVPRLYRERDPYALWNAGGPAQSLAVDRPVIMGHYPLREPLLQSHVLAIDTGAGTKQGGRLSALLLPERRTLSVPAPGLEPWGARP